MAALLAAMPQAGVPGPVLAVSILAAGYCAPHPYRG
jgi:hypothetical protein